MKIEYTKKIHYGEERIFNEDKNPRIQFALKSTDGGIIQMCCEHAKRGFFEVAYNARDLVDRSYDEKQKPLEKPLICMLSYEDVGSEDSYQIMMPIDFCPFCGVKNEIILLKTVEVHHKFKPLKKEVEEKQWYTEENEVISK